MIVKKYTAATETDAVLKAKEELGLGAVVLNVKTVKQRGIARIFKKNYVEITAALDEKEGQSHASENHPAVSNMSDMTVVNALTETSIEKKLDTLHNLLADQIKKNEVTKLRKTLSFIMQKSRILMRAKRTEILSILEWYITSL